MGPLAPYNSCVSHSCIVRTCVDRDSTIWFFIFFTLVAEPRSSASGLDRSTQQGELRSSAMSGGTDRREDEQVPQFYGRIDEKFAEWKTDVRLWQVEFKVEDRDRLGPRLYRRGLHGQPKITVKTKLGTQDVAQFTVDNIIKCLKDNGYGELLEELGQKALDNYFDMRQGKAESIQDYIFREEILTVALQKDTAIDLDEKIRGYWLMRTSNLTGNEKFLESRSSLRSRHSSRKSKKPSPRRLQRNVRKSGMISVRQETERETALVDTLRHRISVFMETVMMIKLTRFQNQSQIVQSSGSSWMVKNKKL